MAPSLDRTPRRARRPLPLALLVAGLALAGAAPARSEPAVDVGAPAARVPGLLRQHRLQRMDGGTLTLGDLRGEVVVVDFWATWCGPCRRELPRLDALHAAIAKQGGRVIAVSIDEDRRNVEVFVRRYGLRLPVALDGPAGLARELDLRHVPYTLVLDRDGAVAFGTSRTDDAGMVALEAATRQALAAKPGAARVADGSQP